jgi:hypothetical protein
MAAKKLVRDADRQAAAQNQKFWRRQPRHCCQALTPLAFAQFGARQDKSVLLARIILVDCEALPRIISHGHGLALDALSPHQPDQQFPNRPANRIDCPHVATQPLDDARHVDATPTGIAAYCGAAEFLGRHHARGMGRDVDCRIHSDCDDAHMQFRFLIRRYRPNEPELTEGVKQIMLLQAPGMTNCTAGAPSKTTIDNSQKVKVLDDI